MKILDKDYEVKYNLRAMFVMEEITGKAFKVETLLDEYILLYSCIVSVKSNPSLDFNEYIDYCDQHPEVLVEFASLMNQEMATRELMGKKKVMEQEKN